jgi:hypothetical protein
MPEDNPNGQKPPPPESLHFERSQLTCQKCRRNFDHFMLEEIDDLIQLRCGDVLIVQIKMVCLHCGWVFFWNIPEKGLSKMAVKYGELMVVIKGYNPE